MEMMKVLFYQKLNSLWRSKLKELREEFPEVEFIDDYEKADEHLPEADVLVGGKPGRETVEKAARLSFIVVPFAGVNHLPLDLIRERGIRVANSHGNAFCVAERSVALVLAFYGRIIEFHNDMRRETRWHGFWVGRGLDDTWESIEGKSAAILGAGEIGRQTARLLKPFGVETIGMKRRREATEPEEFDRIVYDLDEALEAGEIIFIDLPATRRTQGLLGEQRLSAMEDKFIVNVGRGSIVEEEALYRHLQDGTLRGAAIDCWYTYPQEGVVGAPSRFPIHELDNVVLSPHIAGFTALAVQRNVDHAVGNLGDFLRGRQARFEVDTAEAY
jgi:phosphoglycerate dehydrogenase-like enzyme